MSGAQWFSIDWQAHLRKLANFHYHQPGDFILDLIRNALKRGARKLQVDLTSEFVQIRDNGRIPSRRILESLRVLAKAGIEDRSGEALIHELLDAPGIGWLAVFAPAPVQVTIQVNGPDESFSGDLFPGSISQGNDRSTTPPGMYTMVSIHTREKLPPGTPLRIRESCRSADATIEVNAQAAVRGHLLTRTFLARRIRYGQNAAPAVLALPEDSEKCRLVLTDAGIPWDEINLPPVAGLVFHLQLEHRHPPGDGFMNSWAGAARRLYELAAREFARLPVTHQQRLEELFFLLHRQSGDDSSFRQTPIFAGTGPHERYSLEEIETRARRETIYFHLRPDHRPQVVDKYGLTLQLTSAQLDFLNRKGLRLRQAPEPVLIRDTICQRIRLRLHAFACRLLRLRFRGMKSLALEQIPKEERELIAELTKEFSRPQPANPGGKPPPVWNAVVIDRKAWLPLWPGAKLKGFHFRDLVFARRHPLFLAAADRLRKAPGEKHLIISAFRPMV